MKKFLVSASVISFVLVILLLGITVASAITIVVDGNREALWDGSGGQTPGSQTDTNESDINDDVDIKTFQWTNDTSNFYFLIEVYSPPPLMNDLAPIDICMDTDNDPSTDIPSSNSTQRDRCSYSTGVSGIDTVIEAYVTNGGTDKNAVVYDVTQDPRVYKGNGTLGYDQSASVPVVEIAAPLNLLGYGPGNCPSSIPIVVYYDGGQTNPDDNFPNSGSYSINCGSPTAVTVNRMKASSSTPGWAPFLAVFGLLGVGALGLVTLRKRA